MMFLIAILLLGIQQLNAATGPFCYHDPACAPAKWPAKYPGCNGTQQSPVNINTDKAVRKWNLGPFSFQNYDNSSLLLEIMHTKNTIRVTTSTQMKLSGGGLPGTYLATQFHLHWGNGSHYGGSEHWMDGRQANMELHIVHRRQGLNLTDVFKKPEGLAVLGFLIQIESNISEDQSWKNLTKLVSNLTEDGDKLTLDGAFSMMDLIDSINLTKYYRYNGSLTTPECNEIVLWTVFEEPIRLNASLVETFYADLFVNATQGIHLLNNFRPVQENRNPIWASREASQAAPTVIPTTTPSIIPTTPTNPTTTGGSSTVWTHPLGLLLPLASILKLL
ncbi:carbonic anhydrase 4-like [Mobula hypostoma]|uniref:carbonic anhydrase 4-like n=1 Tax=Mobula hypostoma TaxID=723540 RepID=UPI002FC2CBB7